MVTPGYGGVTGVGTACRGLTERLAETGHVVDVLHMMPGRTSAATLVDHAGSHRRPRPLEAVLRWKREYDIVHFHDDAGSDGRDGGFRAIVQRHPVPAVVTLHSLAHSHQAAIDSSRWRTAVQEAIQADLIHRACAVIALTPQARDSLALRVPAQAGSLHVVGNGVRVDVASEGAARSAAAGIRHERGWGPEVRIILYLGRLSREKGIVALAEAFVGIYAHAPDTRLVLAGPAVDGSARQAVDLLHSAGLEESGAFHVAGPIHPRDRTAVLRQADLVVLPSRVEQHPMVPLEAMAAGRPVVLTGLPHLAELYAMEDAARRLALPVPPPATAEAIRDAVLDALGKPEERAAMVRRARSAVERRFGWPAVAEATVAVYEEAAARSRAGATPASLLPSMDRLWNAATAPGSGATVEDRTEIGAVRLNLVRAAWLRGDGDGSETDVHEATDALWRARPRDEEGAEVAVVVPVHLHEGNGDRLGYLSRALDSVFAQDLPHPIVILVLDDGSTVGLEAALDPKRSGDGAAAVRTEVIRLPHHTGHPGLVRLEGYRWAVRTRTPYVAHLDSDDVMLPHRLRVTRHHLESHPEVDVVHAAHRSIDGAGRVLDGDNALDRWYATWRTQTFGLAPGDTDTRGRHHRHGPGEIVALQTDNFVHNATVLIRSSALLRAGLENLAPTVAPGREDHELWRRLCRLGSMDYLNEVVAEYRQHPESLSCREHPQG